MAYSIYNLSTQTVSRFVPQNLYPWLRALIVIAILALSAGISWLNSPLLLQIGLLIIAGIVVTVVFTRWPPLGLLAAIISGLLVPFMGPSGSNATMVIIALLLALWLFEMIAQRHEVRLVSPRTTRPLIFLLAGATLSLGIGQLPWFTFIEQAPQGVQLAGFSIFVLSAGAFILTANQVNTLKWLETITWVFLAVTAVLAVGRGIPGIAPVVNQIFNPPGALLWIWMVGLAFGQAVFNHKLHPNIRLVLAALVVFTVYVLFVQRYEQKSGWMPVFVTLAVIMGARSWRAALILGTLSTLPAMQVLFEAIASDDYSVATRLDALIIMGEIIKINPLFGLGFANYYWYTVLFPIRGWAVEFNSHNNYADVLAQTGLIGLVCLVWFFWEIGRLAWHLRERAPTGFARAYVYGSIGGLAGMLIAGVMGDWVLPFFYNIGLQGFRTSVIGWIFLGGLVTIARITQNSSSDKGSTHSLNETAGDV